MNVLHPQVQQLLQSLSGRPAPQPWEIPITAYREAGEKLIALAGDIDKRCTVNDFTIPVRQGSVTARSYRPPVAGPVLPGVVYLHGGAFVRGSLDTHDRLCRKLCVRGGFVVISVAYRLAPEARFPAAHHDAADATAWVSEHADELGIDAEALAVAGDSSGGALAASVALASREQGPPVRAQGLLCPALDATMSSDSVQKYKDGPLLTRAALEWAYGMYIPEFDDRDSSLASPLLTQNLKGAPPAVIVSAQVDPVADDAQRYGEKLTAAGVNAEFHEYEGMPHSFPLLAGVLDDGDHAITVFATELAALLR
ncbi:lipase [Mycolicibacterium mageritense DSM 44476 = CIP 104973]|uniref:Acetylhydrolase n=1 Tax=Mycolicibacterium mageritense TaxID=53462 RepID=A0ABM7HQH7_MYCME|nr:alpha/beta hydrolase [Mycolicibacterium mageritense]MCC9183621.1 alpha/beta hydrolase [Mycolicibacterium mageritense]BBX32779.1 acetylhydrolase [Mycolicibacterium mageritense]CDO22683.1 esterase/lipase [Mycolicibacterium mageritense DSM 44476 = CIP 104973]